MRNQLSLLILLATLIAVSPSSSMANELPAFPFLLVEGNATAEVRPDKATITAYVTAFNADSGVAVDTVQQRLIQLLGVLETHAIPEDAITSFNLSKEVERERKDRIEMEIVGYHVSRRLKFELDDVSKFAELMTDIARLDNVSSLDADFDISDRAETERRLMREAGTDARRKAENMVDGMSRTVAAVHAVSSSSFRSSMAEFSFGSRARYAAMAVRADYMGTIFEPSTIRLNQSIHVIFELE